MYIIDPEGNLIYYGAIDDICSTRTEDIDKVKNYVSTTPDDLLAGQAVKPFKTVLYGCSVKYK